MCHLVRQSMQMSLHTKLSVLFIQWGTIFNSPVPSNLLTIRVGPCSDSADNKTNISISEMSIFTRVYDATASGTINISKSIDNGWTVKGTMQKCQDIRNLVTCDHFKSFPIIKRGCEADPDSPEFELYALFFHYTQPRLSCPIKAGSYEVLAYPFLIEDNYLSVSESKISTSVFGYTVKLEGFQAKEKLFCLEAYLQLIYIRENRIRDALGEDGDDESNEE